MILFVSLGLFTTAAVKSPSFFLRLEPESNLGNNFEILNEGLFLLLKLLKPYITVEILFDYFIF